MPANLEHRAVLSVPKSGHDGLIYAVRGRLKGYEGEWYRTSKKGRDNFRVIRVGPDGRAVGESYRVAAGDFEEDRPEDQGDLATNPALSPTPAPEISVVAQNGAVVITARLRATTGIAGGSYVTQEFKDGGILIRSLQPSDGRRRPTVQDLDRLLAGITPENRHEEFDFGPPVGREIL